MGKEVRGEGGEVWQKARLRAKTGRENSAGTRGLAGDGAFSGEDVLEVIKGRRGVGDVGHCRPDRFSGVNALPWDRRRQGRKEVGMRPDGRQNVKGSIDVMRRGSRMIHSRVVSVCG